MVVMIVKGGLSFVPHPVGADEHAACLADSRHFGGVQGAGRPGTGGNREFFPSLVTFGRWTLRRRHIFKESFSLALNACLAIDIAAGRDCFFVDVRAP
jgi:hypothetical protein